LALGQILVKRLKVCKKRGNSFGERVGQVGFDELYKILSCGNVKSQPVRGCSRFDREVRAENFERFLSVFVVTLAGKTVITRRKG